MPEPTRHELPDYRWREYDFEGRVYRIEKPVALCTTPNGTTHRVEDADGIMHIVPAVGHFGCVVRYAKTDGAPKTTF